MAGKAGRSGRRKGDQTAASGVALPAIDNLEPPDWLDTYGREMWAEILDELANVTGLLSNIDRHAIAQYCEAYQEFRLASEAIGGEYVVKSMSTGSCYQNPLVGVKNKALERMRIWSDKLGMNPAARLSMKLAPQPASDDEMDAFAKIYRMRAG